MIKRSIVPGECQALVVTCIDFRFQKYIQKWTDTTIVGGFDRVAIAGGVKSLPLITEQVALSHKLHKIRTVYLINHEDCGAYGEEGSFETHKKDLKNAQKVLAKKFPDLQIVVLYLKLSGDFVAI